VNSLKFSLPLRERIKASGAVKFFPFHQPSPPAGEGRVRGSFKLFSFSFLSTLRERFRVRGAVNFFHPHLNPPPSMGRKLLKKLF